MLGSEAITLLDPLICVQFALKNISFMLVDELINVFSCIRLWTHGMNLAETTMTITNMAVADIGRTQQTNKLAQTWK